MTSSPSSAHWRRHCRSCGCFHRLLLEARLVSLSSSYSSKCGPDAAGYAPTSRRASEARRVKEDVDIPLLLPMCRHSATLPKHEEKALEVQQQPSVPSLLQGGAEPNAGDSGVSSRLSRHSSRGESPANVCGVWGGGILAPLCPRSATGRSTS